MSFLGLTKRELLWYWKSPSLLWSFFPLLLLVHLFIVIHWYYSGLTVPFAETMWQMMSVGWMFGAKSQIENNMLVSGIIGPYLPVIDEILRLTPQEVWKKYLVPFLQVFSCLPLGAVIPPLAVSVFQRDLNHGAYRQISMNGTNPFLYLLSKLLVLAGYCFIFNLICHVASLWIYQQIPGRGEMFEFLSIPWILCHFVGVGFGAWISVISWWGCLGTRNGCSEIYVACVAGGACVSALAFGFYLLGVNTQSLAIMAVGLLLTSPIGLLLLWLRMRQPSFILNH